MILLHTAKRLEEADSLELLSLDLYNACACAVSALWDLYVVVDMQHVRRDEQIGLKRNVLKYTFNPFSRIKPKRMAFTFTLRS